MDQLKAMVPAIKQHSFWAMCLGILGISIASWWMSTSSLKQQENARKADIESSFGGVNNIRSQQPKHPNQSTSKGMDVLLAQYASNVAAGWQIQYDHQATVLVWPASFDQEFHDAVNKLRPIEAIPVTASGQIEFQHDLSIDLRQIYRNYIKEDLPILAKTIGTEWTATSEGIGQGDSAIGGMAMPNAFPGGALDGTGARAKEDTSIVIWSQASQQEIMKKHFAFTDQIEPPSTLEVLYAQEDLWVLQSIMDLIRAANAGAEARHEAAIKEIHFIRVGRSAFGLAGEISKVGQASSQGGGTMDSASLSGGPGAVMPGGPSGMGDTSGTSGTGAGPTPGAGQSMSVTPGGAAAATTSADLAEGRYVDEKYQPLPAQRLRSSLTSRSPEDALLAVAKRMPVRLRFKIDQRRMHRLLAECGNSKLPVEVRQVRINRPPAASGGGMSSGGGDDAAGGMDMASSSNSMIPGMGGGEDAGAIFGGSRRSSAGSSIADATIDPNLVDVELYGIVYIYNPVNKSQLGLVESATTVMGPGPSAAPTTPAAAPATSATSPASAGASIPAVAGAPILAGS